MKMFMNLKLILRMECLKMKQKNLFVLCGCPASGKSTWVKEQSGVCVSRDAIRFSLLKDGDGYFAYEDKVYEIFVNEIQKNLDDGKDVYADATHLNETSRVKLLDALNLEGVKLIAVRFDTPLNICLKRNEKRAGRACVPRSVLRRMFHTKTDPAYDEKYKFDEIIIVKGGE
jgi:2',3'-cyclic-nucleotide 3'-phosphodiesterase